ncbi:hypothetical protein ACHAWF_004601, partial [Thalassiosira exigua]
MMTATRLRRLALVLAAAASAPPSSRRGGAPSFACGFSPSAGVAVAGVGRRPRADARSPPTRSPTRRPLLASIESVDADAESVDHAPCFDGICRSSPEDDAADGGDGAARPNAAADAFAAAMADGDRGGGPGSGGDPSSVAGEAVLRLGHSAGPTVWSAFGRLADENPSVANLGQGFPDWLPPDFAVESLVEAAVDSAKSPHQYTRTAGHPNLVRQLARRYSRHLGRDVDAMNEVTVTVGASQALYLCLQTLVKPGDEVVLFEPFFDLYVNQIKLAGGTPVYVPLTFVPYDEGANGGEEGGENEVTGGTWILEPEKLEAAVSTRTRAVILNSPHNPTGKIFTLSEMESIARCVAKAGPQCTVISDEVYKYIVHSPPEDDDVDTSTCPGHVHFASLPDMWDRTITVSSAGKTFSATGWQVGWCVGPSRLISPLHRLLPYVQFCASTVIQEALARTLPRADAPYRGHGSYYAYLNDKYLKKRDLLGAALREAGFAVPNHDATPGGGFFIFARITPALRDALPRERLEEEGYVRNPAAPNGEARLDWALCQWMAEERGVLCIPSSPFFSAERAAEGAADEFVRVAFCKTDETLARAATALGGLRSA